MYVSRQMNTGLALALFERSEVELDSTVTRLIDHPDYDDLLSVFKVAILPSGRVSADVRRLPCQKTHQMQECNVASSADWDSNVLLV